MPQLALSMIVRDAQEMLGACLESVRGVVDEIVVADTGSRDASPEVAKRHGARLISLPWENDFAQARNRALAEIQANWVLVLDADEQLDPDARRSIRALIERSDVEGYQVTIRNYVLGVGDRLWDRPARENDSDFEPARKYPAYVEHENVRLFRRRPEIYFVGRVHETVGHRILEMGGRLGQANFLIHHFGLAADTKTRAGKNHLYRELGRQKVRDMPRNAQAHFELGLVELDCFHNDFEAVACFERACQLDPRLGVAWFFSGLARLRTGRHQQALESFARAEACGHRTALVAEAQGDGYYNLGRFEPAGRYYQRALERSGGSAETESKLGLVEIRLGHVASGLKRLREAIRQRPTLGDLYDRLMVAGVFLGQLDLAAEAAEAKLERVDPHPNVYLRAASIRAQQRNWPRAVQILRAGLGLFPEARSLQQALNEAECQSHQAGGGVPEPRPA
jgi:tetratricopeptide (TPR) repeat protein